ncbi:hypothetical protein GR11A_00049 [Vibrio phage vB_VcorM_GR11A]|nr:hypothetical protein GR11A_00049 [Vibrio phage vB_VcorM_GR11A]
MVTNELLTQVKQIEVQGRIDPVDCVVSDSPTTQLMFQRYLAEFPCTLAQDNGNVIHFKSFGGAGTLPWLPTALLQTIPHTDQDFVSYSATPVLCALKKTTSVSSNVYPMTLEDTRNLTELTKATTFPDPLVFSKKKVNTILVGSVTQVAKLDTPDGLATLYFMESFQPLDGERVLVLAAYDLPSEMYSDEQWVDLFESVQTRGVLDFTIQLTKNFDLESAYSLSKVYVPKLTDDYDFLAQCVKRFNSFKDRGMLAHLQYENGAGATTAVRAACEGHDDIGLIMVPNYNVHQMLPLFPSEYPTSLPCCVDVDDPRFVGLMEDIDDYERGQYFTTVTNTEEQVPILFDYLTHFHSKEARSLELNREFGHACAKAIGFNVPVSIVVRSVEDWLSQKDTIPTNKVAVKYLKEDFIDIFEKDSVERALPTLLKNGDIFIEQYLGDGTNEFNVSFLINEDYVVPLLTLWEVNRILANNGGGKGGDTITLHDTDLSQYPHVSVMADQMRDLHTHVDGLFGWIDAGFMVVDGVPYFTEWMVRQGCSNNATLTRQLKTPLPLLLEQLDEMKVDTSDLWVTRYSSGVSIYSLPLSGGNDSDLCFTNSLLDYTAKSDIRAFDFIDSMQTYGTDFVISRSNHRYGVAHGFSDNSLIDAYENALSVARQCDIMFGGFREEKHLSDVFTTDSEGYFPRFN